MQKAWIGALALLAILAAPAAASAAELAALGSPGLVGLRGTGFELGQPAPVRVEAVGREAWGDDESSWWQGDHDGWVVRLGGDDEDLTAYAWILDADTREVVWDMDVRDTEAGEVGDLVRIDETIELPAGRYEVYLTSNHSRLKWSADEEWGRRSVQRRIEEVEEELEQVSVTVSADLPSGQYSKFDPDGVRANAVVAITGVGDSQLERRAFSLDRETRLQLYGLMEYPSGSDGPADFGWIVDLDSGERVWDMSDRRGRRAGGASKNRLLERDIDLGPGRYMLVYGTDDSHSAAEFNAPPPDDPLAWGVQLFRKPSPGPATTSSSSRPSACSATGRCTSTPWARGWTTAGPGSTTAGSWTPGRAAPCGR